MAAGGIEKTDRPNRKVFVPSSVIQASRDAALNLFISLTVVGCALLFLYELTPLGQAPAALAHDPRRAYVGDEPTGPWGDPIPVAALGKAAIGLKVQTIERKPLSAEVATYGKVEAIPTREFVQHALLSGRITDVDVNLGDTVMVGQVLLHIDSPEINQLAAETLRTRTELEGEIKRVRAELDAEEAQAQAQVDLWTAQYKRDRKLYDEGIAPMRQWQESLAQLKQAESRLLVSRQKREVTLNALQTKLKVMFDSLKHRLQQLGVPPGEMAKMLSEKETILAVPVTSSRAGTITEIQANVGESIDMQNPLFRVSDLTRVWVTADVYQEHMARMRLGQNVRIKVAALPHEEFRGKITFVGREVNPTTRTLPVRVEVDNRQLKLKPDMFAELFIETSETVSTITVPREAVIQRTGHYLVFVETGNGYQPTRVEVGDSYGDNIEILKGLAPGQKVVVRGAFQLASELLKEHGGRDLFVQPTEGGQPGEHEQAEGATRAAPWSPQLVGVMIAAAFLAGFVISALMIRSGRQAQPRAGAGAATSTDSERIGHS